VDGLDGVSTAYGWARVALGAVLTVAPVRAAQLWVGPAAGDPAIRGPLRALAVRDLALGLGVLRAGDPRRRRELLVLCAIVDAGDAALSGADYLRGRRLGAGVTALGAAGAAALALWAASQAVERS
jgi:hypothetical protein